MFRKPAVAAVILLTILAAPAARGAAASLQDWHTVTVSVPTVDLIKLTVPDIDVTLQASSQGIGFKLYSQDGGAVEWATNASPRKIWVKADGIPGGVTLRVAKSLSPKTLIRLHPDNGLLVDDASYHGGILPMSFGLYYEIEATLAVPPKTYTITVTYTLTG